MDATIYQLPVRTPSATPDPDLPDRDDSLAYVAAKVLEWDLDLSGFTYITPSYRAELERAKQALSRVEDASVTLIRAASQ